MVSARRLVSRMLTKLGARIAPREPYVPTFHRSVDQAAHDANCQRWRDRGARIGRNVRLSLDLDHINPHLITIGDSCVIGGYLLAHGPTRPIDPVVIGSNVYIGWNAIILPGVTIGDNCIVGAGSVVTKAIPAGSVAAGNPARVIRPVDDEEIRQFLSAMETGRFIGACDPSAKLV